GKLARYSTSRWRGGGIGSSSLATPIWAQLSATAYIGLRLWSSGVVWMLTVSTWLAPSRNIPSGPRTYPRPSIICTARRGSYSYLTAASWTSVYSGTVGWTTLCAMGEAPSMI